MNAASVVETIIGDGETQTLVVDLKNWIYTLSGSGDAKTLVLPSCLGASTHAHCYYEPPGETFTT